MNLLEVKNISKTYGNGETAVKALKDVSFSVPKGEYVAIVGESGSGKSTLLNMIGALEDVYKRQGYDMDILPPDLVTYSNDAKTLLEDLQSRNERMFLLTFLVVNMAPTRRELDNDLFTVSGIVQKYNCTLKRLDFQQEDGFLSSLPLGHNGIEIKRGMTTSSTAIFVPFMTQELRMDGEAVYYGLNALSHNVIMANRKKLKNPNGLYHKGTGTPRKTQARAPFAAQTDRERRKRAEMKSIQRVFGSSSDLHPVFLLFVRGRFRTAQVPDCPVRKQERSFATFYTNRLQNSMRKGAAA